MALLNTHARALPAWRSWPHRLAVLLGIAADLPPRHQYGPPRPLKEVAS